MLRPLALSAIFTSAVVIGVVHCTPGVAVDPPAKKATADEPGKPTRRALLVGVTKYPNLSPRLQLVGPANDVILMKNTLVTHFAVPEANVVILSEAEGEKKADRYPTRANIEREFKRLAEIAQPDDELVIMLGGHGSQQPEKPGALAPVLGGLNGIFLPRDVGVWNDVTGSIQNAIIDAEIEGWVDAIRTKKAFVWLAIDACHSGPLLRGLDEVEKPRKADPVFDLAIPQAQINRAAAAAAARAGPGGGRGVVAKRTSIVLGGKPGAFGTYAAPSTEVTVERLMPPSAGKDGTPHGVFTYTLCQVLTQAKTTGLPISYRELGQRIQQQYTAWGRSRPTPMVEHPDTDPDREVLGPGVWKDRSPILLTGRLGSYRVNAGQLLGLTPGSVLKVMPLAGVGDRPAGHVKVTEVRLVDSDVVPCAYDNTRIVNDLPAGGRCSVVFLDDGDLQMRVAVATHYPSTDPRLVPVPADLRAALVTRLKTELKPEGLFRLVDDPRSATWLVALLPDGQVSLLPVSGWSVEKVPAKSRAYGPVPPDDGLVGWLKDALGQIARAQGLLQLAADRSQELVGVDDLAPKFKVDLIVRDATGTPTLQLPWPASDLTVYDRDRLLVRVTNTGRVAFDLTLLYVDADHAINGLFPQEWEVNQLEVKDSTALPLRILKLPFGAEHVVLMALKADGPATNFRGLVQKRPDTFRQQAARCPGPWGRVARRVYGDNNGLNEDLAANLTMGLITWQVKATPRPK